MDTASQAPTTAAVNSARTTTTREQRGVALFREGAVSRHGDAFVVRGARRNYTVFLHDGEPRCDCPDFGHRRETCKHGFAAVVFAAKPAPRRRDGRRRTGRRHGRPTETPGGITETSRGPARPSDTSGPADVTRRSEGS